MSRLHLHGASFVDLLELTTVGVCAIGPRFLAKEWLLPTLVPLFPIHMLQVYVASEGPPSQWLFLVFTLLVDTAVAYLQYLLHAGLIKDDRLDAENPRKEIELFKLLSMCSLPLFTLYRWLRRCDDMANDEMQRQAVKERELEYTLHKAYADAGARAAQGGRPLPLSLGPMSGARRYRSHTTRYAQGAVHQRVGMPVISQQGGGGY
jgi:hypothetical protein